ncbi:MAG: molybdenum cofactor guanylyltransferase [Phyllobacteriaceae bacterium]|nr:molybdenum cofactor guanylyltransferase [Phyllobacteriaceae bacterium]
MPDPAFAEPIAGVILAGGQGRRFGGVDKALLDLDGRPLLDHVIERFGPQGGSLFLSANGDPARFAGYGLDVVADPFAEPVGPLAGLAAAGLRLRRDAPGIDLLASVAVDTPRLPRDLVARLAAALAADPAARVAIAVSRGREHPVAALHRLDGLDALIAGLADGSIRRVMRYVEMRGVVRVGFADEDGGDPFLNLNRREDFAEIPGFRP